MAQVPIYLHGIEGFFHGSRHCRSRFQCPPTRSMRLFTVIHIPRYNPFNRSSWIEFEFNEINWKHFIPISVLFAYVSHYKWIDPKNKNKNLANHITKIHSQIKVNIWLIRFDLNVGNIYLYKCQLCIFISFLFFLVMSSITHDIR